MKYCTSIVYLIFVLVAGALPCPGCSVNDDQFFKGKGSLNGIVRDNDGPFQGAEVFCANAQCPTDNATETNEDGEFRLNNLEVGKRDIIIRAPNGEGESETGMGFRAQVRIVADIVYDLGTVSLEKADDLSILIKDPEIPICQVKVGLKEIPGVEAYTDFNGEATIPCVPMKGCYTLEVLGNENGFAFGTEQDKVVCYGSPPESAQEIVIEPDGEENLAQAQIHNAYARLNAVLEKIPPCQDSCQVPAWWPEREGSPCPWVVTAFSEPQSMEEKNLKTTVEKMDDVAGERQGLWKTIKCPAVDKLRSECDQGNCGVESSLVVENADLLCSGSISTKQTTSVCHKDYTYATTDLSQIKDKLSELETCFDPSDCFDNLKQLTANSVYVLIIYDAYIEPPCWLDLFVVDQDDKCNLFFRCTVTPFVGASSEFIRSWFLYHLVFEATPPSPGVCTYNASLSWINSENSSCQMKNSEEDEE